MVTAAFGLITLLPLLAKARHLGVYAALSLMVAVVLAAVAGMQPAYSDIAPERLNPKGRFTLVFLSFGFSIRRTSRRPRPSR